MRVCFPYSCWLASCSRIVVCQWWLWRGNNVLEYGVKRPIFVWCYIFYYMLLLDFIFMIFLILSLLPLRSILEMKIYMVSVYIWIIVVYACCTIISININKYSKVNCTLNRVYKIHDDSFLYSLSNEIQCQKQPW